MKIAVIKKKADPMGLRISIGRAGTHAYIVYRGHIGEVKMLLTLINQEFQKLEKEPEISDDGGKKYA